MVEDFVTKSKSKWFSNLSLWLPASCWPTFQLPCKCGLLHSNLLVHLSSWPLCQLSLRVLLCPSIHLWENLKDSLDNFFVPLPSCPTLQTSYIIELLFSLVFWVFFVKDPLFHFLRNHRQHIKDSTVGQDFPWTFTWSNISSFCFFV